MKKAKNVVVPYPPMSIATYGDPIQRDHLSEIIESARLPISQQANLEDITRRLSIKATGFVLFFRMAAVSPPGELASWCREVQCGAEALLAQFEIHNDIDEAPDRAAIVLFREPCSLISAPIVGNASKVLTDALTEIRFLAARGRIAAEGYESKKGSREQGPAPETIFIQALGSIFRDLFDREPGLSTDPQSGERGGPFVRFCVAVIERLRQSATDMECDATFLSALDELRSPTKIADRIRDAVSQTGVRPRRTTTRQTVAPRGQKK